MKPLKPLLTLILLGLGCLLNELLSASKQKPVKRNKQECPSSNHHDIPASEQCEWPIVNTPMTKPASDEEQWHNEQKRYWERQIRLSKWLNWVTGVAATIALGGLYFVGLQADSARTAADIAKQGFDESVKTFRLEQRAWVLPKDTRIRKSPDTLHLEFQMSNSGKVPASIVGAKYEFANVRLLQCPTIREDLPPFGMPIPPNGERWLGLGIKGETREQVGQSESVYVYGQINYTDIFPGTKHSLFCSIFHPKSGAQEICPFCNAYD
jgi:hypothetical protein